MKTITFKITDPVGLHARPTTVLVSAVNDFSSIVELEYKGKKANLKSIMSILGMAVPSEAEVHVHAEGQDEDEVISRVIDTINETGIAKI